MNLGRKEPKCHCPCPWHFITAAWWAKVVISKKTEIFCKRTHHHAGEVISRQNWETKVHTNKFNSTSTRVWSVSWGRSYCKIITMTLGRLLGWPALFCHTIPGHRLGMGLVRHLLKKYHACGFIVVRELSSMATSCKHYAPEYELWPLFVLPVEMQIAKK